jgi:hypothetical protein
MIVTILVKAVGAAAVLAITGAWVALLIQGAIWTVSRF